MRRFTLLLLLCALLAAPALSLAEAGTAENLLINPGFEDVQDGWPLYWEQDKWLYDEGITYMDAREGGRNGGLCAMIENVSTNDARFVQSVPVEPDTIYRLSGWVKAENCDPGFVGASLSVIGSYFLFPDVHDTAGEWVELECYVETREDQTELRIGARLGDYSSDTTGKAWFDDLSLTPAEAVPIDARFIKLVDYSAGDNLPVQDDVSSTEDVMPARGDSSPLIGALLLVALCLGLWVVRAKRVTLSGRWIWALLALAAAVRLYLMAAWPGYDNDMACFFSWARRMVEVGPNAFYADAIFCDYPPGYLYLLWITGALMKLFGVTGLDTAGRMLTKIMPLLADMGMVYLIWRVARKRLGDTPALLLAALYALNPAVLVDGAMWGQVDSVIAIGLFIAVMLAADGNWKAALPVFVVTALMKPQALMVGPIGLIALVMDGITRKDKKFWKDALIGTGISVLVAAILLLPFLYGKAQPLTWIYDRYAASMDSADYQVATLNAANLYYLFGGNWLTLEKLVGPFTIGTWGTILMVVSVFGVMALYAWRGDRERLPYYGALILIALFVLGVKMHERYLFPALALLLYAYIRRPDKRVLMLFAGFSLTFYLNCSLVLRDKYLPSGFGLVGCLLSLANILLLGAAIWVAVDKKTWPLRALPEGPREPVDRLPDLRGTTVKPARMSRADWALMLGLTAVYAVIAYVGLGSNVAPQTGFKSTGAAEVVTVDFGSVKEFNILYYSGINQRDRIATFEFSTDGESWADASPASLKPGDCFQWKYVTQASYNQAGDPVGWQDMPLIFGARYVQIAFDGPALSMMEVVFRDTQGNVLPVLTATRSGAHEGDESDPALLFDEPETVPDHPSYYNSMYFDEIYHGRTGYEHLHQLQTYEWTHPPLGKVLIMLAIKIFGMNPFAWRFMGTLMGVLMVPMMYLMGKLLFKRTRFAFLAAFVMAFDMMHLTQTRIATIDSYAVLCIIIMYYFMFRYMRMSFFRDGWRTLIPLGLSGLFMGIGCASKWICFYAGMGLAILFFWTMGRRFLDWRAAVRARDTDEDAARCADAFPRYLIGTFAACLAFFIVIPFAIYYLSYIPHFAWEGGLTLDKFIKTQQDIFRYHSTLTATHSFMSAWYEWLLMLKPMYYYSGKAFVEPGNASTIMAMGNPAVWWVGLLAVLYVVYRWLKPHLKGEAAVDHRPAMLLVGYLAQLVPWMFVTRAIFIYHYFGSLPFAMLCIVYAFERLYEKNGKLAQYLQFGYMGVTLALFVGFYPVATGVEVPVGWINAMNWLGFLKLPGWRFRGWIYY